MHWVSGKTCKSNESGSRLLLTAPHTTVTVEPATINERDDNRSRAIVKYLRQTHSGRNCVRCSLGFLIEFK